MNTFRAVFLTALLGAGITKATDPQAEKVAMETLSNPNFLAKQNTLGDQVNMDVLGVTANSKWSEIMGKNPYGVFTDPESKSTVKKMLDTTEGFMKNTMEYIADAGKTAVTEAKKELPGAMEKAKEMGESMVKTVMKYMKEMMSTVMNMITKSWDKMMGKDESKGQKISNHEDESAMKRGYASDSTQDDEPDNTNTSMNQDDSDNQSNKFINNKYRGMLDTLSQEG
jgi:hypothetical protein